MVGLERGDLAHALEDVPEDARTAGTFPSQPVSPSCAPRTSCAGTWRATTIRRRTCRRLRREPPAPSDVAPPSAVVAEPAPAALHSETRDPRPAQKIDRLLDLVGETVLDGRRLEHVDRDERSGRREIAHELDLGEPLGELKDAAIEMRTVPLSTMTALLPGGSATSNLRGQGRRADVSGETPSSTASSSRASRSRSFISCATRLGTASRPRRSGGSQGSPHARPSSSRTAARRHIVEIVVSDDGRGVSRRADRGGCVRPGSLADSPRRGPGFSTAAEVTRACRAAVSASTPSSATSKASGGTLEVRKRARQRAPTIVLVLPTAPSLCSRCCLVERGGDVFGLPLASVEEAVSVKNRSHSRDSRRWSSAAGPSSSPTSPS